MPTRSVTGSRAGWVGKDDDRKLEPLCSMDRHHPKRPPRLVRTIGASSAWPASASASIALDKGAERGGAALLEPSRHVHHPQQLASACSPVGHIAMPACARTASSSISIVGRSAAVAPRWRRPNKASASATSCATARAAPCRLDAWDGVCVSAVHHRRQAFADT